MILRRIGIALNRVCSSILSQEIFDGLTTENGTCCPLEQAGGGPPAFPAQWVIGVRSLRDHGTRGHAAV